MFKTNPKLKRIFLLGFLLALHFAFTSYINSSFLSAFSGEENVGLIYILGSLASLVALYFIPGILQRTGEYKFLLWASGLNALLLLLLSLLKTSVGIIPVFIFYFILNLLIVFAMDELVEMFSKNSSTGLVRGVYLTFINLAWVIAQTVSGKILSNFTFSSLYLLAFLIMATFFIFVSVGLKNIVDPKYDKVLAWQSFKNFFRNKNLARAYKMNFLLQFFYVWMVIYTPIYLHAHLHFAWEEITTIFAIMLLPFVLIQFPLGRYSDKIGEKKMLRLGFLAASLATFSLFFITRHEVWIWAIALFATRVGAATIEIMSDVYFFKHIERENDEFIAVYRNTIPMSYIIAPFAAFVIFRLVPSFNYIFLILGVLMLYGVYLAGAINKKDV